MVEENTVQHTLCMPLWGRMLAEKHYPNLFPDRDAGRILEELGVDWSSKAIFRFQYMWMNCAIRQYNLAWEINEYLKDHPRAAEPTLDWGIRHGIYAYDAADPFGYVKKLDDYKMTDIGPRLTQDVLVLGASEDHFIAKELYVTELDNLPNVKSLTYRLMTAAEDGQGHCNVGNPKLVLDTVLNWLTVLERRDRDA